MGEERVGLVLTGGGARGAYEVGALSVLLPALEAAGQRPTVLVGTSVGAINIAYFAANAHLGAADAVAGGIELWHSLRWEQVLAPLLAPSTALRKLSYLGDVLGVPGVQLTALLDTTPLTETVPRVIDFERLHRNVEAGRVHATAVVATSAATSESVVFGAAFRLPRRARFNFSPKCRFESCPIRGADRQPLKVGSTASARACRACGRHAHPVPATRCRR